MNRIKLYPVKGTNEGDYVFFDAGSDIELYFGTWGTYHINKGDVLLMGGCIAQGMVFGADLEFVYEKAYFEGAPKDYDFPGVWCRDPRIIMGIALCSWVGGSIAWDDEESLDDDEWAKRIEEIKALEKRVLEDFNKLINPLPSMEEAKSFLKANGLLREDVVIDPDCFGFCEPGDFINTPPQFLELVEKYKAR